jgi:hypothetical protein
MAFKAKTSRRKHRRKSEALKEITKEDTIRFNALLPESIYQRLQVQAMDEGRGRNMTKITIDALNMYFKKHPLKTFNL